MTSLARRLRRAAFGLLVALVVLPFMLGGIALAFGAAMALDRELGIHWAPTVFVLLPIFIYVGALIGNIVPWWLATRLFTRAQIERFTASLEKSPRRTRLARPFEAVREYFLAHAKSSAVPNAGDQ